MIIDGRKLASQKEAVLQSRIFEYRQKTGRTPKLVAVMVGDDEASLIYVGLKEKAALRVGFEFEKKIFDATAGKEEIIDFLVNYSNDSSVDGILVQLPLADKLQETNSKTQIIKAIVPSKDVDCLTPENVGLLQLGQPRFLPATVKGIMQIILNFKFEILNLNGVVVTVVGASDIVGKPLAVHLKNLGATVSLCDSQTNDLGYFTKNAEILVSATGVPGLITKEMVKPGALVIDVGSPKGDVDFEGVKDIAGAITPVPGGVGPLTVVSLLENVWLSANG